MTTEEIEREAKEYADNLMFVWETDVVQRIVRERVKLALIDVLEPREKHIEELEQKLIKLQDFLDKDRIEKDKKIAELEKENKILSKALNLYINWADECGIAWDNFPDMQEKWYKTVEEKGLGWIAGLTFMVMSEAEQLLSEVEK